MNKVIITGIILLHLFTLTSCEKYLQVQLDNQMTQKEVFSKRSTTEAYLAQVYSYLPKEHELLNAGSTVPRSDEALFSWWSAVDYIPFNNGSWGPTSEPFNIWSNKYTGINQATIFMNHVGECKDLDEATINTMRAEARFLRAYFYFELVRQYGPVYIWGDKDPDRLIRGEDVDRHSLETNINFIISEYDKAIEILPLKISDHTWNGRITKGIVMAAKARLLLYAASPLFNGCELYKGLKNREGEYLFPQYADLNKWEDAAKAARTVIDLGIYSLYENQTETDPMRKAIKSYQGVIFDKWNNELIWGMWKTDGMELNVRCAPPRVVKEGYGGYCPSMKLVDTYPMALSGRYPISGYNTDGTPVIDNKSGYQEYGFTNQFVHPLDTFGTVNAHNSCVGRDARFYASILANGFNWINTYKGTKLVTFYTGGTSTFSTSADCIKVGYLWRRMTDPTLNIEDGNWGQILWPLYRLAEIYLNYAEACNEKPNRNETEALLYINKVRNRSGLNNLESAYPEVIGNKVLLRELIQKERMVELAFEGHRYHDVRRWMIAEKEMNGANWTRNLLATNYEDSWTRTDQLWGKDKRVFLPKHYFFPINQKQLNEMKNITQNYGW